MSRAFKLTIAYDGTDYAGWQVQPGKPTVQGTIQSALRRISDRPTAIIGSGRTDAGVHALAQVASCKLHWRDSPDRLVRALNANLPDTIAVADAVEVLDRFHPIRDAKAKRYRYQLQLGGTRDVFDYRYRWHLPGLLDVDGMRLAAWRLVGRHDFESFQASGSDRKTTVRDVRVCRIDRQATSTTDRLHLAVDIEADGFLYNMVRNMVGTLVEVGRGKHAPEWIDDVFAARNRAAAGPTAPAHGLFLVRVDYDHSTFSKSTADPVRTR